MYYSKPIKSYEAVCEVLDQVASEEARPVHWRKPLYAAIDELNEAAAPAEQIKTIEQLTIVLLKLEWARQRGQTDKVEAASEQLARLSADWRSMVEADDQIDVELVDLPAMPAPRSIAQLQDLLAEAEQDHITAPDDSVAPPRWLTFEAPQADAGPVVADEFASSDFDDPAAIVNFSSSLEEDLSTEECAFVPSDVFGVEVSEEAVTSHFGSASGDEVEDVESPDANIEASAAFDLAEECANSWVPRNEGLPFGNPNIDSKPHRPEIASSEAGSAGIDFLAASRSSFDQSRIDFRDPYRDEDIESVAEALERITVRSRSC